PGCGPFKHRVEVDPKFFDKSWKKLDDAIREIYNHNASGLSFEELYRTAYNMVLHKHGGRLYDKLAENLKGHLREMGKLVEAAQGGLFLEELQRRWADHIKALQMIRDILMYMDRTFIPSSKKTPVFEHGLELWRDIVVRSPKIHGRLVDTLLELIHRERMGEMINRGLMRNTTKMLMELGSSVYQDDFERPFLEVSASFYSGESQQCIERCDCGEYLKNAEKRLAEESERVSLYMDAKTADKIANVVDKEMLSIHMQRLFLMENSGLVNMLINDKHEDLTRMYDLFKRVPDGHSTIRSLMASHVKETGKILVTDPERLRDPVDFVQRLLNEKDKYDEIVSVSFSNDKTFQNALNASFEHFINLNNRSPEFISLYVDDKLRKGVKGAANEEDIETVLDKVMMLFRYLQEKDVFEKYYKQHLAKRLLSGKTSSDEAERNMLVKLKTECGYQFTSKLESMFTDLKTSQDTMQSFYANLSGDSDGPTISVQILTTGSWPTQPCATCNLPPEILGQTNMGNADIKATFGDRKHELNVSTYQMCVLMLFNSTDTLTYKEIEQNTAIPPVDLKRCLQSLACVKGKNVLRKEPMSKDISDSDAFHFNDKFSSKLVKVKIGTVVAQKESEPEKQETRHRVEEDRKPQIEAAIVRIMKSRRVLDHNSIVTEVTKQLQARFLPNPVVIKKRIESLIEREFLERDKVDRKLYRYLA
uniref:Cullin family profile domain-containing protein n=1 Tax=Aegilops tauschii subsp. strangulata TaxID=200361 RepID=A0A453D9E9_AEGTS